MPHIPHWYVRTGDMPAEDFDAFVEYVRQHGYRARWGRYVNHYLELAPPHQPG